MSAWARGKKLARQGSRTVVIFNFPLPLSLSVNNLLWIFKIGKLR